MRKLGFVPLLILSFFLLTACGVVPPPIGANLPNDFQVANAEFKRRVEARFPLGSSEQGLVAELVGHQGFVLKGANTLIYDREGFPCRHIWRVVWEADTAGRLTRVAGDYGTMCL